MTFKIEINDRNTRYMFRRDIREYILQQVALTRFILSIYFKVAEIDEHKPHIKDEMQPYNKLDKLLSGWLLEEVRGE